MPTISKIFVDTNVFVALVDESDSTHHKAINIASKLLTQSAEFYTSSDIIGESATVIAMKLGKVKANQFIRGKSPLGDIREIFINEIIHNQTRKFFARTKSKNVSFIDCSSVIAMKRNKINVVFSFDSHFRSLGVKLIEDMV